MTKEELATERLIFIALLKAVSEQATYLTGELRLNMKQEFNILVKQSDQIQALTKQTVEEHFRMKDVTPSSLKNNI